MRRWRSLLMVMVCAVHVAYGQEDTIAHGSRQALFRDTTDGAFDVSSFLIDANGFIPMPFIISEPALGGFGFGLGLVFLTRKNLPSGLTNAKGEPLRVPPDITMAAGLYTANKTWGALGGRIGIVLPWKLRYRLFAGYFDVNMAFYRTLPLIGEQKIDMNMRAQPIMAQALKKIGGSDWYLGGQYTWAKMDVTVSQEQFSDVFAPIELDNTMSMLGAVMQYDGRDNFFSPRRGICWDAAFKWSSAAIGSSSDYTLLNTSAPFYLPVNKNWTCGLRGEYQQVWSTPLFYQLPYINLRGVPVMRYQGRTITMVETEQNIHLHRRWSMVAFTGAAKAFNSTSDFNDAELVYNVGLGPRYLIASAFGLQMGVDVARGPEQFAWYLVFGSAWSR